MAVDYFDSLLKEMQSLANLEKAKKLRSFFKTKKGEYAEGDVFLGIVVPEQRKVAKRFFSFLSYSELKVLLDSKIHEERLVALLILVQKYEKCREEREKIFQFYLASTRGINNWDLVDLSAPKIIGDYLLDKNKKQLISLAKSSNLWERRIAIVSTWGFIKKGELQETIKISKILLHDEHDLIHKAVGWMLREMGKKDEKLLVSFLDKYFRVMPRTMLRYSIEKMPEDQRKKYLKRD